MKYRIQKTNKFIKQYSKILKQNNFKEEEFINVLKMLLEYKKSNEQLILLLVGIGSHSNLFK